jgi:hypothetical protein
MIKVRDFYFCAPGSLVVLSFPQPLNFSSVSPCSSLKPLARVGPRHVGPRRVGLVERDRVGQDETAFGCT